MINLQNLLSVKPRYLKADANLFLDGIDRNTVSIDRPLTIITGISMSKYDLLYKRLGSIAILYKRFEKIGSEKITISSSFNKIWNSALTKEEEDWENYMAPKEKTKDEPLKIKIGSPRPILALTTEVEKSMSSLLLLIQEMYPDLVLKISNRIYADLITKVRKVEQISSIPKPTEDSMLLNNLKKGAQSVAKQVTAQAIFFASEAYVSEGAVIDIVICNQGAIPQSDIARKNMLPVHYLESFNEQYADFLKDLKHYSGKKELSALNESETGKLYYRSSKYLSRLFATGELFLNIPKESSSINLDSLAKKSLNLPLGKTVGDFRAMVDKLVKIRKGQTQGNDEIGEVTLANGLIKSFGIENPQDLADRIATFAQAFNIEARKRIGTSIYATPPSISDGSQLFPTGDRDLFNQAYAVLLCDRTEQKDSTPGLINSSVS